MNLVRKTERFRFIPDKLFDFAKLVRIRKILLFPEPINPSHRVNERRMHITDSSMFTITISMQKSHGQVILEEARIKGGERCHIDSDQEKGEQAEA